MSDHEGRGDEGLDEEQRQSRETGGDAPAAGSIDEREAVAEGEGADAFPDEDASQGGGDGQRDEREPGEQDPGEAGTSAQDREGEPAPAGLDQDREGGHDADEPPTEPPG